MLLHPLLLPLPQSSAATQRTSETDPITAYTLRTLTKGLMDALNTNNTRRSLAFLEKHMAAQFVMQNSGGGETVLPDVVERSQHLDNLSALRRLYPAWILHLYNLSAVVEPGAERAAVIYTARTQGGPADQEFNSKQEMVGRFCWRKREKDGTWECYLHEGLRLGGDFDTFSTLPSADLF